MIKILNFFVLFLFLFFFGGNFFNIYLVYVRLERMNVKKEGKKNKKIKKFCNDAAGIIKSDEIMVINGAIVSDLDMMYLESVLQEELALCMMMRSSRTEPPDLSGTMRVTDEIIESLVCPPPPTDPPVMSEEMITGLIVPAPVRGVYIHIYLKI